MTVTAAAVLMVLVGYRPVFAAPMRSPGRTSGAMRVTNPRGGTVPTRSEEILERDRQLGQRIQNEEGHLGGAFDRLERQDGSIRRQETRDMARSGGTLSVGEAAQLQREENALAAETRLDDRASQFTQEHPRRAQILGRDARLDYTINKDEGHLGGNYTTLEHQDAMIRQQEQADAHANGGVITPQEKTQLQQEEQALAAEVRRDRQR
jgi:hypothetical protein